MAPASDDWLSTALGNARAQGVASDLPAGTTIAPAPFHPDATLDPEAGIDQPLPVVRLHSGLSEAPGGADLHLRHLIGKGGIAEVWSARQIAMQRDVAVKQLQAATAKPETVAGLIREARLAGRLEHPNILPIHALAVREDGDPLIVMKRVDGVDWFTLIAQTEHPEWAARPGDRLLRHLEIFVAVCRAVELAHSRGILHLDIKPGNVMVGAYGETYLMDWGLAVDLEKRDELPDSELVGTPAYLPPEMLLGRRHALGASDVYLLGATLHHALVGRGRHDAPDLKRRLHQAMLSEPATYDERVPDELAAICNRACAGAVDDRFDSVRQLREAVERFVRHRGSSRLSDAASAQLDELRQLSERTYRNRWDGADRRTRRQQLATSARFGFEAALEDWPDNPAARTGRERALEELIELELEREHPEGAAALMEQLEAPRPDLERRHDALLARLDQAGDAARRLRALERDISFAGTDARHSLTIAFNGTAWSIVALIWGEATRRGWMTNTPEQLLTVAAAGTAVLALWLAAIWKHVVDNAVRRRFVVAFMVFIAAFDMNKVVALLADLPLETIILADHAALRCFVGFGAAVISPICFTAVVVAAGGFVATVLFPQHLCEIAAADLFLINGIFAWAVRPQASGNS